MKEENDECEFKLGYFMVVIIRLISIQPNYTYKISVFARDMIHQIEVCRLFCIFGQTYRFLVLNTFLNSKDYLCFTVKNIKV